MEIKKGNSGAVLFWLSLNISYFISWWLGWIPKSFLEFDLEGWFRNLLF